LLPADPQADLFFKWLLCVLVILVVDLAWLLVGVGLNKASLPPAGERVLNLTLGALIVCAAILIYL
jgi:hypothetical protein